MKKFKFLGRAVLGLTGNGKGPPSSRPTPPPGDAPSNAEAGSASSLPRFPQKHAEGTPGEAAVAAGSNSIVSITSSEASLESGDGPGGGGGHRAPSAAFPDGQGIGGGLLEAARRGQQQLEQVEGSSRCSKLRKRFGNVCARALNVHAALDEAHGCDGRLEAARQALWAAGESIVKACNASAISASKAKGRAGRSVQEAEDAVQLLFEQARGGELRAESSEGESPGGKSHPGAGSHPGSMAGSPCGATGHPNIRNATTAGASARTIRHLPPTPETKSPSDKGCMDREDPDHLFLEAEASLSLADSDVAAPSNYKRARTLFLAAARAGHSKSMLRAGQCLLQGLGGPKDEAEGRMWMTRSAVEGDEEAECEVALHKERSEGPGAAIPLLRSLVSKGNTGACVRLAELMLAGDCEGDEQAAEHLMVQAGEAGDGWAWNRVGVLRKLRSPAPPPGEGSAWMAFKKGCELGCRDAMNNLGVLCEDSDPPDFAEACRWYAKAAAAGHLDAVNNLGYALLVQGDARGAVARFEEAVRRGCGGDAKFNLASVLEHGSGCFQDTERAKNLYLQAAAGGCGKSAYRAGCLVYEDGDLEESVRLFRQSAGNGNPRAMNALGVMMEGGQGGAEGWYRQAAERGCADAAFNLGLVCEREGRVEAVEWYRRAHEMGHGGAMAEVLRFEKPSEGGHSGHLGGEGAEKGSYRDRILYGGLADVGNDEADGGNGSDPYAKYYDEILDGKVRLEDVVQAVQGGQSGVGVAIASSFKQQNQSPEAVTVEHGERRGDSPLLSIRGSSNSTPKVGTKDLLGEAWHLSDGEGAGGPGGGAGERGLVATPKGTAISRELDGEKHEAVLRLLAPSI